MHVDYLSISAELREVSHREVTASIEHVRRQSSLPAKEGVQSDIEARKVRTNHTRVVDGHLARLTDAVSPRSRLVFLRRIPVPCEMDDVIRRLNVDAKPTASGDRMITLNPGRCRKSSISFWRFTAAAGSAEASPLMMCGANSKNAAMTRCNVSCSCRNSQNTMTLCDPFLSPGLPSLAQAHVVGQDGSAALGQELNARSLVRVQQVT